MFFKLLWFPFYVLHARDLTIVNGKYINKSAFAVESQYEKVKVEQYVYFVNNIVSTMLKYLQIHYKI